MLGSGLAMVTFYSGATRPNDSGFRQDGYFIWCGSIIRVADQYHLFASRWPEGTGNPNHLVGILDGYRLHSYT